MPTEDKLCARVSLTAVVLLCLLVASCSSITPYQPRNHREEGPERGLFTGSKGEFVVPIPTLNDPAQEDEKTKTTSEESSKSN